MIYIDFLRNLIPNGPWSLVALNNKADVNVCRTFFPGEEEALTAFVEKHNGKNAVYFHVNSVEGRITKKAAKTDIRSANALYVDIDPEKVDGEVKAGEVERIRNMIVEGREGIPSPTAVIYSGGGFQLLWKLDSPFFVLDNPMFVELVEGANRFLERAYSADHCHNIERLLRLPGTVNVKYASKPTADLVAELTDWTRVHNIASFQQTPGGVGSSSGKQVDMREIAVEPVDDLMVLQENYGISDNIIRLIATGTKETDGEAVQVGQRSERLFEVVCALVRKNVPREVIMGVLLAEWEISASVLEKKNPKRYAERQIARAEAEVEESWLAEMNRKYAVVKDFGGKTRVVYETVYEERNDRRVVRFVSVDEFPKQTAEKVAVVVPAPTKNDPDGTKVAAKNKHKAWLDNPYRREYDRATFTPRDLKSDRLFNLWRGFAFEPKAGDCGLYLRHLYDIVCGGNREYYDYLLGWMSFAVQRPYEIPGTAILLQGATGTGKTIAVEIFGRLFGVHYTKLTNPKHLVGQFNAHLEQAVLVLADEAMFSDSRIAMDTLKTLVTDETLDIERKGLDRESGSGNYLHIMLCTEEEFALKVAQNDRRFFILSVSDARQKDRPYFRAILKQMDEGGYAALLHYLMERDLSDFDVRYFPETEARIKAQQEQMSEVAEWLMYRLQDASINGDAWEEGRKVRSSAMFDEFIEWRVSRGSRDRFTGNRFSRELSALLGVKAKNARFGSAVYSAFELPSLAHAMKLFNARFMTELSTEVDDADEHNVF